jgi:hypothetical protein
VEAVEEREARKERGRRRETGSKCWRKRRVSVLWIKKEVKQLGLKYKENRPLKSIF